MDRTIAVAWFAGLYEGEGTVIYGESHLGPLRIKISSTDRDVLDMIVERLGVGNVFGPYEPQGFGKKPFHTWVANGFSAAPLLREIMPFLGERRSKRALEKITLWEQRPLQPVADWGVMRKDRASGMTYADIGRKHGVSTARAFQVCKDGARVHRRWGVAPTE